MPKLSDPIQIGEIHVKNRLFAGPIVSNWGNTWGGITDTLLEGFELRAKGGFGLVTIEATTISPRTNNFGHMLEFSSDKHIPGFNKVAQVVHRWGAKTVIQLQHGGRQSTPSMCDEQIWGDCPPLAPSKDTPPVPGRPPVREMTPEDIEETISQFVRAATLAQAASLDGVLFHLTHGFLCHQFLSPWLNRRTDEWGIGNAQYRFCTEIIRRTREAVGRRFIIGARIAAEDSLDAVAAMFNPVVADATDTLTIDRTAKQIAPQLAEAGLDYIEVTTGVLETVHQQIPPLYMPRGYFIRYAEEIRKNVKIPVVSGGKVCDPLLAARLVEAGRVDAVFMGRPGLADPASPRKFFTGRRDDVRQCIFCDHCTTDLFNQREIKCAINPDIGPLKFEPVKRVFTPKKVLVVGGGVGGMEAARVAHLSGHDVTLCEKRGELGGMVKGASKLARLYTRDLANITQWQEHQLSKLSVKVELNRDVTPETVKHLAPDCVILATGSTFDTADLKGGDQPIAAPLDAYLMGKMEPGQRVVIIGGAVGAEPALSLAREGKEVTILESGPELGEIVECIYTSGVASGPWMYIFRTWYIIDELRKEKNATLHTGIKVKAVTSNTVEFMDANRTDQAIDADSVIVATGHKSIKKLGAALTGSVPELYEVGDCVQPGRIKDAIYGAHRVVRSQLNEEIF
jgi:2,4-dienoyl-CoA reductase-like NADH-dependent reductase (Old Yellow Enzyme family)/pyruvate/2-oxoglutarate dehydrogenase complex dihydrolipoamide dehydrogenase (E3) component